MNAGEWRVEFYCPDAQVIDTCPSEQSAREAARSLHTALENMAKTDQYGGDFFDTIMIVRPDGTKYLA